MDTNDVVWMAIQDLKTEIVRSRGELTDIAGKVSKLDTKLSVLSTKFNILIPILLILIVAVASTNVQIREITKTVLSVLPK